MLMEVVDWKNFKAVSLLESDKFNFSDFAHVFNSQMEGWSQIGALTLVLLVVGKLKPTFLIAVPCSNFLISNGFLTKQSKSPIPPQRKELTCQMCQE